MRILMARVRLSGIGAVLAASLWLAACSSSASQPAANAVPAATTSAVTISSATTPASASSSASPSATGAQNLVLTDSIRAQLVAAAAKLNGLPASAYLGLVRGESYYGFDPPRTPTGQAGRLTPAGPPSRRRSRSKTTAGTTSSKNRPADPGRRPPRAWEGSTAARAQSMSRPRSWLCGTGRQAPVTPQGSDVGECAGGRTRCLRGRPGRASSRCLRPTSAGLAPRASRRSSSASWSRSVGLTSMWSRSLPIRGSLLGAEDQGGLQAAKADVWRADLDAAVVLAAELDVAENLAPECGQPLRVGAVDDELADAVCHARHCT